MAKNYQVTAEQLAGSEGEKVLIRGKLGFARLTSLIEGEELAKRDAQRAQKGWSAVGKPHTTASITHSEVVFRDPANPTLAETYVSERRYPSKEHPETGPNYSVNSKLRTLPIILAPNDAGQLEQVNSTQELARGLDVTFVLNVFKPKNLSHKPGIGLDQVIVNEKPRFYTGGIDTSELEARGFTFAAPPVAVQAPAQSAPAGGENTHTVYQNGFAAPAPVIGNEAVAAQGETAAVAAPAAPAPQAQAAPAATAVADETIEDKLARLEAENARMKQSQEAGESAIGYDKNNPWGSANQAGISYQG